MIVESHVRLLLIKYYIILRQKRLIKTIMKTEHLFLFLLISIFSLTQTSDLLAREREKYNFNSDWLLKIGDIQDADSKLFPDKDWKKINLPRAFNEDDVFRVYIRDLTDTIVWYRKHFKLPEESQNKKVFIEFEGVRQGADFYINGKYIGLHENGVMAVGFDLTPYLNFEDENVIAIRIDNNWDYVERSTGTKFQWSDRNFNVNYGGIPKNVWLHITDKLYQTLPLYSNLKTTGIYIYADDIRVNENKAIVHAESEIRNEHDKELEVSYEVNIYDRAGELKKIFQGDIVNIKPGETKTVKASSEMSDLKLWSWGYGYLYDVRTRLLSNNKLLDEVSTKTGFRKTRFENGKFWLNDRVIQIKGYAQRTSNEWPGVGISVPPWLSDFSNDLMVKSNANTVRWMHVTPWKQDVESCDRVGLMQLMPAGDSERDVDDRRWGQRLELMRDAIIYNRNNPSIIFYESGNKAISRDHMIEMKAIRDQYDPHGGRAIGSREMLDISEAEWGGEMLYINKSNKHPMFATEYSRDEGLRKYWDEYSYPYHIEGEGPLYNGQDASDYNHNQDMMAVENVRRWYDYWYIRPGTGDRISSGGLKIIFSDTQTHSRGAENYRRSGVVDPLRIEKDGFYAHQVMWDGWVDVENHRTHIIGHWDYKPETIKPVYVVSSCDKVELFVNGISKGFGKKDYRFLFTFDNISWERGELKAVSYDSKDKIINTTILHSTGEPERIKLSLMKNPQGFKADGADLIIVQVEVIDKHGNRCPLANNMIDFSLVGPAEWRGGIAQGPDNFVLAKSLPVECGVNRVVIRSTNEGGDISLIATSNGLVSAAVDFVSEPIEVKNGLTKYAPGDSLKGRLDRGETPSFSSYEDSKRTIYVESVVAGANNETANNSFDDNELSEWSNDGRLSTAWITYKLQEVATIDEISLKLTGWRMRSYPLEIFAGNELTWSGETKRSLGYVHLKVNPVRTDNITIRLKGASIDNDAFSQIVEVAAPVANELDLYKAKDGDKTRNELRIVEVDFLEYVK